MHTFCYEECTGSEIVCYTCDRGVAGWRLTGGTVLCPWARHFILCLVLVNPGRQDLEQTWLKIVNWDISINTNKQGDPKIFGCSIAQSQWDCTFEYSQHVRAFDHPILGPKFGPIPNAKKVCFYSNTRQKIPNLTEKNFFRGGGVLHLYFI